MPRTPTLVKGGETLRNQINERFPNRDKASDGWIGDKAHQNRKSDHNPDEKKWVHALDIDENMGRRGKWRNGLTARHLADQIVRYAMTDLPGADRVKYVVYENQIASGTYKKWWWLWRGKGYGHTQHIHVSFTAAAQKDGQPWPLPILTKDQKLKRQWRNDLKTRRVK